MNTSAGTCPWRTVWVIGASHGIGRAFAELCTRRGATVIASARSAEALREMARENDRMIALPFDVADVDQAQAAVTDLVERGQLPDLTVFGAATYTAVTGLDIDAALFARHMQVNYLGAVNVLSALLPPLAARARGHIALVASLSGYRGLPLATAYGPSKAALISLCESLKPQTDAAGLDLSVVNPGFVRTRLTEGNRFKMPYLMEPDAAADAMYDGLARREFEVAFPGPLVRRLKLARLLPYSLYFRLIRRLMR